MLNRVSTLNTYTTTSSSSTSKVCINAPDKKTKKQIVNDKFESLMKNDWNEKMGKLVDKMNSMQSHYRAAIGNPYQRNHGFQLGKVKSNGTIQAEDSD